MEGPSVVLTDQNYFVQIVADQPYEKEKRAILQDGPIANDCEH
jgi:hypothetical protein